MILWATITALVVFIAYLAGYLCAVKPATFCRKEIWPVYVWRENPLWGQEFWTALYAPVHWFDFRIRRSLWQPADPREFRGRFYYRPGLTTIDDWRGTRAEAAETAAANDENPRTNDEEAGLASPASDS